MTDTLLTQINEMLPEVTQGEWRVDLSDNATPHIYTNSGSWEDGNSEDFICRLPVEIVSSHNSLNNARLIALAPQMAERIQEDAKKLAAFKQCVNTADGWEDGETFYKETVETIRDILNKQQGE